MLKKFMIEKIDHEQVTDTAGKMVFHLADEAGQCRTVSASTFLNEDKEPQGVSTDNIRELPLIEGLFSNRHKKMIEVEFDHFNKAYNRETDQTINQMAYEAVLQMEQEKKLSYQLLNLFKR